MTASPRSKLIVASALLVAAVALVYAPVRHAEFFHLDDPIYVTENPHVRGGLTADGLRHAFLASHAALWMPLTFTSHMVDVEVFGLTPTGPHVVNVLLHALNAGLLLWLLARTTGALVPSVIVAALFALHPLRVESVAWIAERKDVLAACFGLLTMHAWVGWVRRPSRTRYVTVVAGMLLALLSKPMLVTLPIMLLCLDWWPLRRSSSVRERVIEKLPLFALAAGAGIVTLYTAYAAGAFAFIADHPLPERLAHAAVALVWYAAKTAWPVRLAILYPIPQWAWWQVAGAVAALAAAGVVAVRLSRRAPWIVAGLVWFVVGLLPVSGIVQAGAQGMADRFTYLPTIGLLVAVVWTFDATAHTRGGRVALAGSAIVVAVAFAIVARRQVGYWRNSETLYTHTLAVTDENWVVQGSLGDVLMNGGRPADAYPHFAEAFRIEPRAALAAFGMGSALDRLGRPEEAVVRYREALRIDPTSARAHNHVAVYLGNHGDMDGAIYHFSEAVRFAPGAPDFAANLKQALESTGIANTDAYLRGIVHWGTAVAADRREPGGASYGATLSRALVAARPGAVGACLGVARDQVAPFNLYLEVAVDGALTALTAAPSTQAARCLCDELRTARVPAPPFAPFRAAVPMPAEG
jgi:tetratricopeptide (TPR) repeat protein